MSGAEESLTLEEVAELRVLAAERRRLVATNERVLAHEMATPWRGHDEDGMCCRRAAAGFDELVEGPRCPVDGVVGCGENDHLFAPAADLEARLTAQGQLLLDADGEVVGMMVSRDWARIVAGYARLAAVVEPGPSAFQG